MGAEFGPGGGQVGPGGGLVGAWWRPGGDRVGAGLGPGESLTCKRQTRRIMTLKMTLCIMQKLFVLAIGLNAKTFCPYYCLNSFCPLIFSQMQKLFFHVILSMQNIGTHLLGYSRKTLFDIHKLS